MDTLAPLGIGQTDHGTGRDGFVLCQSIFDLGGVDVLATGDDHVLDAIDDEQVTAGVEVSGVAGMHPPVAEHFCGLLRFVPVSEHDVAAERDDFAHLAGWEFRAGRIDDFHLAMRERATSAAEEITTFEVIGLEDLGFVPTGQGRRAVAEGWTLPDGRIPTNLSGGLKSRGHPVGTSGLAQIVELQLQLTGRAEYPHRQVRYGLAYSIGGLATNNLVTILERSES